MPASLAKPSMACQESSRFGLAQPKRQRAKVPTMTGKRATSREIDFYLAHRINEEIRTGVTLTRIAELSGITAAHLSNLKNQFRGAGWKTIQGLAKYFGMNLDEIEAAAMEFAKSRPDLLPAESRVEYDRPRAPVVGAMEGFAQALKEAKQRYRHIPDYAWDEVGNMTGFRIRPPITADLLLDLALVVAKHGEPAPED